MIQVFVEVRSMEKIVMVEKRHFLGEVRVHLTMEVVNYDVPLLIGGKALEKEDYVKRRVAPQYCVP